MTKIKDLVTVHVDTAYRLFPIDAERYELCVVIGTAIRTFKDPSSYTFEHRDPRVKEFLQQTQSNFLLGCQSMYSAWIACDPRCTDIVFDRARRCEASLASWLWSHTDSNEADSIRVNLGFLWVELLAALLSPVQQPRLSTKGHGG
jgi:hypothetical protein